MSDTGQEVQPITVKTTTAQLTTDPVSQAGAVQGTASSGASSTFTNLDQLKAKEPEFWEKMMNSMAMGICNDMKAGQERIKAMKRNYDA